MGGVNTHPGLDLEWWRGGALQAVLGKIMRSRMEGCRGRGVLDVTKNERDKEGGGGRKSGRKGGREEEKKARQKSTWGEQIHKQIHNFVVTKIRQIASRQIMLQKFICKSVSNSAHFYPCGEREGGVFIANSPN